MSCTPRMSTRRQVGIAATAIAIVTSGVAAGSANAAPPTGPDVVGSGPVAVTVGNNARLSAAVKNVGVFSVGTTFASITLQRVSRRFSNGQPVHIDTPGTSPITGVGMVDPIAPGFETGFSAVANAIPRDGLHRVTVCADISNFVNESAESNNCDSEIQTVVPFIIGG